LANFPFSVFLFRAIAASNSACCASTSACMKQVRRANHGAVGGRSSNSVQCACNMGQTMGAMGRTQSSAQGEGFRTLEEWSTQVQMYKDGGGLEGGGGHG
jgi:hypothetical protein